MIVEKGMKFLCIRTHRPFYTEGKTYEVLSEPNMDGTFHMTDDNGTKSNGGRGHDWGANRTFKATFRLVDEPPQADSFEAAFVGADMVNHPPHYTDHPSGVECIQITEHMNFCRGNAVKYIWRAGEKGDEIEDLKKARWYIDREISRLEK